MSVSNICSRILFISSHSIFCIAEYPNSPSFSWNKLMQKAIGQEKMNLTVPAYFLNHYALAEYRERITPTFFFAF